ncbi:MULTISPECIES: NAD(P)H-dependent flavin oxidoreductase [Euryhalocaulis]|uniref:NAD(P)H-dependent flavin oxidoreductase n=1 Tax=Euryhalocaulis TaxID=1712422 RepID=UPI00039D6BCB|nr:MULTISPECIES: nitronate monooxygenase [Euryhalocaulis]
MFDVQSFKAKLRLPAIAAPMFLVSGPDLVIATCKSGMVGSFPAPNARDVSILDDWMSQISSALDGDEDAAPWALNMVVHSSYDRLDDELALVSKYKPGVVITALGGPQRVIPAVHDYGGAVFADVNSLAFAKKAAAAGADGLVLVSSGAGGHTGEMSGFAFVDAVRQFFDGPIVLAGSIATGRAVRAAEILGADLAYVGTQFIAAAESIADPAYKEMLVSATIEDIQRSDAITGVPANWLKPSLKAAGIDLDQLKAASKGPNFKDAGNPAKAWKHVWSAGHGVGQIDAIRPAADIIDQLAREYDHAKTL